MKQEYITPTKESPVFKCHNDFFGYIEEEFYKQWQIKNSQQWVSGCTFALCLTDAIISLHEYIKNHKDEINPKSKFIICMVDGSIKKNGDIEEIKCYSISMKQAKQFKLI